MTKVTGHSLTYGNRRLEKLKTKILAGQASSNEIKEFNTRSSLACRESINEKWWRNPRLKYRPED